MRHTLKGLKHITCSWKTRTFKKDEYDHKLIMHTHLQPNPSLGNIKSRTEGEKNQVQLEMIRVHLFLLVAIHIVSVSIAELQNNIKRIIYESAQQVVK